MTFDYSKARAKLTERLTCLSVENANCVVALLDVKRFRLINRLVGYSSADAIVRRVASKLSAVGSVFHIGIDRFCLVVDNANDAVTIRERVYQLFSEPEQMDSINFDLSFYFSGISFPHISCADEVFYTLEEALNHEKLNLTPQLEVVSDKDLLLEEYVLSSEASRFIQNNELFVVFHPIVDSGRNLKSIEVLSRWNHPVRGVLSPAAFLPYVHEHHLHEVFTKAVFNKALTQLQAESSKHYKDVEISFNIEVFLLIDDKFREYIIQFAQLIQPFVKTIKLELLESTVYEDFEGLTIAINHLKSHGLLISIDDFGSMYSNFERLIQIPFDEVKIEQSFVANYNSCEVTKAFIEFAYIVAGLRKATIVFEGVRSDELFAELSHFKNALFQGFFIIPPSPLKFVSSIFKHAVVIKKAVSI